MVILTTLPVQRGLSERIADAQSRGLERAGIDAAVGSATFLYQTLRVSYLGYRRLFGVITPEEEQEQLAMRTAVLDAVQRLTELDAETVARIAEEFVEYFAAQHAELRLLDLEYRLGLTSEEALLAAYEDVVTWTHRCCWVVLLLPPEPQSLALISDGCGHEMPCWRCDLRGRVWMT